VSALRIVRLPLRCLALRCLPLLVALVALTGCGSDDQPGFTEPERAAEGVELALDFTPNAVHAPVFAAARESGLTIREPGAGPDGLKLVAAGRVDLALLDIHDLAIARESGADIVAVGALVEKPLAALVARRHIRRPRDLEGRTVGVSGLPSDPAFVRAIVEHDGGDYDELQLVTIGFNAVSRLVTGRVDAVPVFWSAEGVALRERGVKTREFRVEDFGAPPYPEVVIITSRKTLDEKRDRLRGALDAIAHGVELVKTDPEASVREVAEAADTDDLRLIAAQLEAVLPIFADDLALDRKVLEEWARFDERIGLVKKRPDVEAAFAFDLTG
jgi:NitT/TauT family transport system substrate-binding protein/putative hydroxymethylpyrimidine transport system substrate-binding protein